MSKVLEFPKTTSGQKIKRDCPKAASAEECNAREAIWKMLTIHFNGDANRINNWLLTPHDNLSGFNPYWFIKAGKSVEVLQLLIDGGT